MKKDMTRTALAALVICHCAGMLDMVALPVWVGALVERYHFSAPQAGGIVTIYLAGAFLASLALAPRFNNLNQRLTSTCGFAVSAIAFFLASLRSDFPSLAALHLIGGLGIGSALSMAHGTMGRTANPHRMFAISFTALAFLAIILLSTLPQLLIAYDGPVLFQVFAAIMMVAVVTSALLFRNPDKVEASRRHPFSKATWFTILGIGMMTFNQSMVFAFVEVIGNARGFEPQSVMTVLIALGLINLLIPGPLAAFLQSRVSATRMTQVGPVVQAILAMGVAGATVMPLWAPAAACFVMIEIFTHTFVFGLLSRLDPTGRATAATPAMAMIGAALGPFVGGVLSENFGFPALGFAGVAVGLTSAICFTVASSTSRLPRQALV